MKIVSSFAFALFLSSSEAFGPASPINGNAFGASTQASRASGDMTMRVGKVDMVRRQKFNNVLETVGGLSSKEAIQTQLLSPSVGTIIEKSNWKLRRAMLRKVRAQAAKFDVEIPATFGVPPTTKERTAAEQVAGAARKAEKEALLAGLADKIAAQKAARTAKKAEKKARTEAAAKARGGSTKAAAPAPEPAPAPASVASVADAAPATPASGGGGGGGGGGEVTPKTIKQLRDDTGAGMMDCKKALLECNGDQEAAADYLRMKGLAKADKKASRVAAEGKIAVSTEGGRAVMVEVNCETDFVGKDSSFLDYCEKVASAATKIKDDSIETLMTQEVDGATLEETRQALVAKIGENIQVRRMASGGGDGKTVGCYVHMNRIGVLVELEGGSESVAMDVAMHVAAMNPPFATADDVPQEVLNKEKEVLSAQALESGKPPAIVEKMVEGRIRKYLEEICLVSQNFVKDGDKTVGKFLEENGAKMIGFKRIAVGEGIEKKVDDFAAEVAKMAGQPVAAEAAAPAPAPAPASVASVADAAPATPASGGGGGGGGEVTPKTIKQLRDDTGAGMMDCKKALLECNGDQEAAADYLRMKGLAKADKKASRVAAEGKIAVSTEGGRAVMVEVNCETDFVGKDSSFLDYCEKVASAATKIKDDSIETLMTQEVDGATLEETRQALVAKIGENIQVRRMASGGGDGKTVGCYVHMNRIGVLVELEGGSESVAMDVAMHVAAMNPPFATADDVPQEVLNKEKEVLSAQALESGKPPAIVEKMVEGRIRKYLEEICLVSQNFVKDGDKTVGKFLEENGAKMIGFKRIAVGEGIEKKVDDFAAEVAKMAGQPVAA